MLAALSLVTLLTGAVSVSDDDALRAFVDAGRGDAHALGAALREQRGPRGAVDVVTGVFKDDVDEVAGFVTSPRLERLRDLIDAAAAQKDGWASGLAWHTDLKAAEAEAKKTGKPILSLRLLGGLDDDLSCANSRFFRTLLYVDPAVQRQLSGFVLHWQTVRPAPRLTIDMGDGRVLTTTITGNSAHLVLDADGRVVDALPGLVSPATFVSMLQTASSLAPLSLEDRKASHAGSRDRDLRGWRDLVATACAAPTSTPRSLASANSPWSAPNSASSSSEICSAGELPRVGKSAHPPAVVAAGLAMAKSVPELPIVRAIAAVDATDVRGDAFFDRAAAATEADVVFADRARRLMARKLAPGQKLDVVVARLRRAVAKDTVLNRFVFHDAVHSWLSDGVTDANDVQNRLYDELFLTPRADPWLGLVDDAAYAGVDGGGLR